METIRKVCVAAAFAMVLLTGGLTSRVHAQCAALLSSADEGGQFRNASFVQNGSEADHIVGLWKAKFVAQGNEGIPDGTIVDSPLVQWHGDGTEFMNSIKPPVTGNICMGVWRRTSKLHYTLNHFALAFQPDGVTFLGPAQIQEEITLDKKGNTYSGTFTISQYDPQGNLLAQVKGNVSANRLTADSTIAQLL